MPRGRLPPTVVVYAIEGEAYGFGEGLAPEVERAVQAVAQCIRAEIGEGSGQVRTPRLPEAG